MTDWICSLFCTVSLTATPSLASMVRRTLLRICFPFAFTGDRKHIYDCVLEGFNHPISYQSKWGRTPPPNGK